MRAFEDKAHAEGFLTIAGVDEAGRGPLAGPVVAAACILPHKRSFPNVNDSKKLSAAQREAAYYTLTQSPEVYFGIGIVDHALIDTLNILQATFRAMLQAISALPHKPDLVLIDGNQLPSTHIPAWKIIDGDQLSLSIAAASILAKVTRDRLMEEYHEQWPLYGFKQHKGYGTAAHLEALKLFGPCPIHRMTFQPVKELQTLSLN